MIKALVLGLFSFLFFLVGHLIVFNVKPSIYERFGVIKKFFWLSTILYIVVYMFVRENILVLIPADPLLTSQTSINISRVINFLTGYGLFVFLWMGYCQFYFFIDRTISGRMIIELDIAKDKKLTVDQLKAIYSPEMVFKRRLQHLLDSKCMVLEDGYYRNTAKGNLLGKLSRFLKEFLKLEPGG
ncbi:MAG: hypothetical protein A2252_03010 [Elusimicrobia bacterium RIFOXYA2_FULL_39_19]|nr:MAG: hypothetical protein A2252_03010 [Elusimicrobia bacterium RIFOXYA2_FULL_39_19]